MYATSATGRDTLPVNVPKAEVGTVVVAMVVSAEVVKNVSSATDSVITQGSARRLLIAVTGKYLLTIIINLLCSNQV